MVSPSLSVSEQSMKVKGHSAVKGLVYSAELSDLCGAGTLLAWISVSVWVPYGCLTLLLITKAVCLCEHLWMMTSSRQTQPSLVGVGSNNGAAPSIHRQLYYFLSDPNIISAIHIQQLKPRRIHNFSITFTAVIVIVPSLLSELLIGSDFTKSDLVAI